MSNIRDMYSELLENLEKCLQTNRFDKAIEIFRSEKFSDCVKNNSWDIIPVVCKDLTQEKQDKEPELVEGCEILLTELAHTANPEEVLLAFIDQAENTENHFQFKMMLKLMSIVLMRPISQRVKSIDWCLNTIKTHLQHLPTPQPDDDDVAKCQKVQTAEDILTCVLLFYTPLVDEVEGEQELLKSMLASYFIQTLSYILPYIFSDGSSYTDDIMDMILRLVPNPWILLTYISECLHTKAIPDQLNNLIFEADFQIPTSIPFENVSIFSYGIFFYNILTNTTRKSLLVPCVHDPKFIFLTLIYTTVPFIEKNDDHVIGMGLQYLKTLLNDFPLKLHLTDLHFQFHKQVLQKLNKVMIFSKVEANRKLALSCFREYILKCDAKACYFLLVNFRIFVDHAGTLGYLITLIKEFTIQFEHSHMFFKGKLLFDLIKLYCYPGDKDIVEYSDAIISSINLLTFLVLKDKWSDKTYKVYLDEINKNIVIPLQKAITLTKSANADQLEETYDNNKEKADMTVSMTGHDLPSLTPSERRNVIHCVNNTVDLINNLLCRLLEFVESTYSVKL